MKFLCWTGGPGKPQSLECFGLHHAALYCTERPLCTVHAYMHMRRLLFVPIRLCRAHCRHMGDTVKPPDGFDPACFRLLNKTAELVSKTSLTSLNVFADSKTQCHYFASPHLQTGISEASSCNCVPPAAGTAIPSQSTSQVRFHPFTPAGSTCLCV